MMIDAGERSQAASLHSAAAVAAQLRRYAAAKKIKIVLRILISEAKVSIPLIDPPDKRFGPLDRVGISLWEPTADQLQNMLPFPEICPVCGSGQFNNGERLSALLMPCFKSGFQFLMGVWVHQFCFQSCQETNEPDPVPW
jgi:hypothetical protein